MNILKHFHCLLINYIALCIWWLYLSFLSEIMAYRTLPCTLFDFGHSDVDSEGIIDTITFSEGALSKYFRGWEQTWYGDTVKWGTCLWKRSQRDLTNLWSLEVLQQIDVEEVSSLTGRIMVIPLCGCPEDLKGSLHCSFKYLVIMLKA